MLLFKGNLGIKTVLVPTCTYTVVVLFLSDISIPGLDEKCLFLRLNFHGWIFPSIPLAAQNMQNLNLHGIDECLGPYILLLIPAYPYADSMVLKLTDMVGLRKKLSARF